MIHLQRFAQKNLLKTLQRGEWAVVPADAPIRWVLDVGANVGMFSVYARMRWPHAKILSVEPDSRAYAALEDNTQCLAVETLRAACGPAGQAAILNPRGRFYQRHFAPVETGEVFCVPLLDLVHWLVGTRDRTGLLLKIDIEGAENYWLENRHLARSAAVALQMADAIAFELHPPMRAFSRWLGRVLRPTHDIRLMRDYQLHAIHAVRKGFS